MNRSRMARRSTPALMFALFLTACGGSSSGPPVDSKLLQQRLDQFVATVTKPEAGSEMVAKAEGAAKVETQSDGTVVGTLPRLTFQSKDGESAVLDPITVKFSNAGDGLVNVEAVLPSTMSVKDKAGKVEGEIKIGSQTLKGVWVEKLQSIDKLDVRLGNITITSPGEPGLAKIEQIAMTGGLTSKGGGLYDGRYDMTVKNFVADDPSDKTVMKMAAINVVTTMAGAKMEDWAKAAKEAGYTLSNPDILKAWTGGEIDPKMIAFMKRMPDYMGTIDYSYSLSGLEMVQDGKLQFALKNTSFGMGVGPDNAGTTKVKMAFGVGGVSGAPEDPLLPPEADVKDASMELEASGVPGRKLWEIYMDALPQLQAEAKKAAADTAKGGDATAAGAAVLEQMGTDMSAKAMEVLMASKLSIALNKLNLSTPTAKMTGKGLASYLPAENIMPEGKVSLRFTGIDALAKAMEKRGAKDEMAQQVMGVIAGVRAMGKPDPASPKDDRAYIIDIQMTKDGKVLANGQDMLAQ
ncbi:MAG: DUF2125 domain-containing protein [Micropepsaceae bacterium]